MDQLLSSAKGDDESRQKARKYIDLVRAQRVGPVHVDETHNDGDWREGLRGRHATWWMYVGMKAVESVFYGSFFFRNMLDISVKPSGDVLFCVVMGFHYMI